MSDIQASDWLALLREPALVVSAEGEIVETNPAFGQLLGLDQAVPGRLAEVVADPADKLSAAMRLWARSKHRIPGVLHLRTRTGNVAVSVEAGRLSKVTHAGPALILLRCNAKAESVEQFRLLGEKIDALSREILGRRRAEEEAHAQREWFRTTLTSIGDAVIATDEHGRVTFMNPVAEQLTGWTLADAAGRDSLEVFNIVNESTRERVESPVTLVIRKGMVVGLANHTVLIARDGAERPIDDAGAPIRNTEGELKGTVLVFRDITERQQAERQLRSANDMLEHRVAERTMQLRQLAAQLTQAEQRERRRLAQTLHDNLQQLLVAARMRTETLERRLVESPTQEAMQQVRQLIDESIETSRSLTLELSPPVLYDGGLCAALPWLARRIEDQQDLKVEVDADPAAEPAAEEVRVALFLAARELLFNTAKHGQTDRARVELSHNGGDMIRMVVEDNGAGFDPGTLRPSDERDTGFGLFSLRERIEFLGGEVTIQSTPGLGTRVQIVTPRGEAASQPPASEAEIRQQIRRTGRRPAAGRRVIRVLLADDHKILREGIAGILREWPGIEVVDEAADGQEAVELTRLHRPDVVVMDITMPRLNGIDATRLIKQEMPHIIVVGLSMHDHADMAEAMHAAGAARLLVKDGSSEALVQTICQVAPVSAGEAVPDANERP